MSNKKVLRFQKQQILSNKLCNDIFNFAQFKNNFSISITNKTQSTMQLQLSSTDPSIANALRRIIISQIPTMAFHKVFLYQNTSVLPDQLLVHRIGLIPINIDSKLFEYKKQDQQLNNDNSIKFVLKVKCTRKKQYENMTQEELQSRGLKPEDYLDNANVYARDIKFVDQGNKKVKNIKVLHENILVAKLRENQEIYLEIYAEKGIGKKHAKWSPVSTCFYRLMPEIKNAEVLVNCCPVNVFEIKKNKAIVSKPRDCTTCRQCIALEGVELGKVKDHFIFSIESIGVYKPEEIFLTALEILQEKAKTYII